MTSLQKSYAALLFDMDGTLLSSIAAAERVWSAWARRHGIDVARFLPTIHGVRAADTIRRQNLPGIDLGAEVEWVTRGELEDVGGVMLIDGVVDFLRSLPRDRWAVVTSASLDLAMRRMQAAGIPAPEVMITAEDVTRGKPDPDGFPSDEIAELGYEAAIHGTGRWNGVAILSRVGMDDVRNGLVDQ